MKTCRWIVITVLASALSMPVSLVTAAPSASITITPPLPSPAPKGTEVAFALVITATDINPRVADAEIRVVYYDKLVAPSISPVVRGMVLRQGTPANPNPGGGTLACSEVNAVFTDPSGKFEFSLINPLSGTYIIGARYPGYLSSETTITIPPSKDVGTTTLCGGDVNADRVINILDIGTITANFGKTNMPVRSEVSVPPLFPDDCADPDEPTDINDDSLVNISDLAIAAGNWGLTEATLWETTQCNP